MPGLDAPKSAASNGVQPFVDANHLGKGTANTDAFSTDGGKQGADGKQA